ncbi:MAG: hypothetical protein WAM14_18095 [Candidatus Nitrosopolaris sp.]
MMIVIRVGKLLSNDANPNWLASMTFRIGYPTVEALSRPLRSLQEVVVSSV